MDNLFSADTDVLQRNTQGVVEEPILKENPDPSGDRSQDQTTRGSWASVETTA